MTDFYAVIEHNTQSYPATVMGPFSESKANKVADGASINLDWDNWSVHVTNDPPVSTGARP